MNKKRICLFTAHSPLGGGGSVIIRSLIANLPDVSISWNYFAANPVAGYENGYQGQGQMGGNPVRDIFQSWRILTGRSNAIVERIVEKLLHADCDAYWIVSHNEGLRVAVELAHRQNRPVHLTVHDDWAGALCARSIRYRLMANSAKKLTISALNKVASFDVISAGMQHYYQLISGRDGEICHRYMAAEMVKAMALSLRHDPSHINIGHIGSIYDKKDFILFLTLLNKFSHIKKSKLVLKVWGSHLSLSDIPVQLHPNVELHKELPEDQVIEKLAHCSFVYSMYPLSNKLRCFSKTSLPTKLTSYVQSGRPIFGHGPADSTLAEFLHTTGTGILWSNRDKDAGMTALNKIFELAVDAKQWETARLKYFGERNLQVMQRAFNSSN